MELDGSQRGRDAAEPRRQRAPVADRRDQHDLERPVRVRRNQLRRRADDGLFDRPEHGRHGVSELLRLRSDRRGGLRGHSRANADFPERPVRRGVHRRRLDEQLVVGLERQPDRPDRARPDRRRLDQRQPARLPATHPGLRDACGFRRFAVELRRAADGRLERRFAGHAGAELHYGDRSRRRRFAAERHGRQHLDVARR